MHHKAFTLIELLIVVAIIAILAAIAVPNFLEAQTRAKVSRAKADMRAMGTALGMYQVDFNTFPYQNTKSRALRMPGYTTKALERITTPIAYLTGVTSFRDPFRSYGAYGTGTMENYTEYPPEEFEYSQLYWYMARHPRGDSWRVGGANPQPKPTWWITESAGPQGKPTATRAGLSRVRGETDADFAKIGKLFYDPTNGTVSRGNIWRVGGSGGSGWGSLFFKHVMKHNG